MANFDLQLIPVSLLGVASVPTALDPVFVSFGLGSVGNFVNKTWDPGGPKWVSWLTRGIPDPTGAQYPDPYATGFGGTTGYRVSFRRCVGV